MFVCLECGKKFKSAAAAERAADRGCSGCGGVDIDLYVRERNSSRLQEEKIKALYPSERRYIEEGF